jgi:hypothetical protein
VQTPPTFVHDQRRNNKRQEYAAGERAWHSDRPAAVHATAADLGEPHPGSMAEQSDEESVLEDQNSHGGPGHLARVCVEVRDQHAEDPVHDQCAEPPPEGCGLARVAPSDLAGVGVA